jgi:hypothetical protein
VLLKCRFLRPTVHARILSVGKGSERKHVLVWNAGAPGKFPKNALLSRDRPQLNLRPHPAYSSLSACVIFYEVGGVGRSEHIAIFRLGADPQLAWHGTTFEQGSDPAGLLEGIEQGLVGDGSKYL